MNVSLRSLKDCNPKAYRELLNSNGRPPKNAVNVSLSTLLQHFESLGNVCNSQANSVERVSMEGDVRIQMIV